MRPTAYLVFCRSGTVLTQRAYVDWRPAQDGYEDDMTPLGPRSETAWVEYFAYDYGADDSDRPFSRAELAAFLAGAGDRLEHPEPPAG